MLALQGLMWSAALWFGWKNRDAIERSVRAARAAWDEGVGTDAGSNESPDAIVAIVVPSAGDGTPSGSTADGPFEPAAAPSDARPGF